MPPPTDVTRLLETRCPTRREQVALPVPWRARKSERIVVEDDPLAGVDTVLPLFLGEANRGSVHPGEDGELGRRESRKLLISVASHPEISADGYDTYVLASQGPDS